MKPLHKRNPAQHYSESLEAIVMLDYIFDLARAAADDDTSLPSGVQHREDH
ncbi:hypothetical protein QA633_35325 [Bradyrhizobium barranii]|uniref:hypothetical protein n=1 Tax=Bradyrhizobium barranii TaxID=2992140 RepID=UPI0024AF930B|nr:hypothetical protein [Bradyrhizobium barranii]WFT93527.1 hypothetical protein QA633_35325 [Bradyrhizobium barranii]